MCVAVAMKRVTTMHVLNSITVGICLKINVLRSVKPINTYMYVVTCTYMYVRTYVIVINHKRSIADI